MFILPLLLLVGTYLLLGASLMNTKNLLSFFLFRVIPAMLGIWCFWEAALIILEKTI